MINNTRQEKDILNKIISEGIKEILHKGLKVTNKSLGSLEDDISLLMRALQAKNKIYDFAVIIDDADFTGTYYGKVIYSLINTEHMGNNASEYEGTVRFSF